MNTDNAATMSLLMNNEVYRKVKHAEDFLLGMCHNMRPMLVVEMINRPEYIR